MVDAWTTALETWFTQNRPSGAGGALRFDLALLSNLTARPMPLVRLRGLRLALVDAVPPLATSQ